jgi:SAM-dependent methyltransferase
MFPYKDWSLQVIIEHHRERLQSIVYDDRFTSQESANQFWDFILEVATKQLSPEQTVRSLRHAFLQSPEAAYSNKAQAALSASNANDILKIVQNLDFPNRRKLPANFIDVGCGKGLKTSIIADAWGLARENAIGLDIESVKEPPGNFDFLTMSPEALPEAVKSNTKDLAILSMVLHHSENPAALLEAVFSALKPGGYLIVREHNAATDQMSEFLDTMHIISDAIIGGASCMPNASNYRSLAYWRDFLQHHGFKHIKTNYVPFSSPNSRNTTENFTCVVMKPSK